MKAKYIVFTFALLLGISCFAQDTSLRQEFENELKAKNENVTSIKALFTQTREMSVLTNVVKKDGDFYFTRPGCMLIGFKDGDYIKMNEAWFEMKTGNNLSSTKISSNPMLKNLNSILSACVVGDFGAMNKVFTINPEKTPTEWILTMVPQRGKAASKISRIVLHFDKKDMSLNILKMEEKSGDYTMYKFTNKQFNTKIDDKLFQIAK
ncbi:MAG: outer membrane lipoprotein carrier protein LolA [Paludibacteraceae bacterium]|jgi:outer membrane lipoprotein-sorting protein|nr:outer membrane lipoprotein carrier protein LolA [Paludibacteraceae bacterium]